MMHDAPWQRGDEVQHLFPEAAKALASCGKQQLARAPQRAKDQRQYQQGASKGKQSGRAQSGERAMRPKHARRPPGATR